MDGRLSAQEETIAASAATVADILRPQAAEREERGVVDMSCVQLLAEHGLLGVHVPTAWGGQGASPVAYAHAVRAIAGADASVAVTMAVSNMVAEVIVVFGSEAHRKHWVPKLTSGEIFGGAFALSEPGAGSDAGALTCKAVPTADGFRLSGEKLWITSGDSAGVLVVWARTGGPGAKGISAFLVPKDAPGLQAGKPEKKMGLIASHTVPLSLDEVFVPKEDILGEEGRGFAIAMQALDGGRIGIGAQAVGMGFASLKAWRDSWLGLGHSAETIPQSVAFAMADSATELEAAWLLVLRAAHGKGCGQVFGRDAAMGKVSASETANKVVRRALAHSADNNPAWQSFLGRVARDLRVSQIYEGTSEIQRWVIGRSLVEVYR